MPLPKTLQKLKCLGLFAECSYYNDEKDFIETKERYQLRKTAAGGSGAVFILASDSINDLEIYAHKTPDSFWQIFDTTKKALF